MPIDSMAGSLITGLIGGLALTISLVFVIALCVEKNRKASTVIMTNNNPPNPATMHRNGSIPGTISANGNRPIPPMMPNGTISPGTGIPMNGNIPGPIGPIVPGMPMINYGK